MPVKDLTADLEMLLASLARSFRVDGKAREVAVLAASKPSIGQTNFDNWNGGTYFFTIFLEIAPELHSQIAEDQSALEQAIRDKAQSLTFAYPNQQIERVSIVPELRAEPDWRNDAKRWLTGQGITNQGRVRSDNVASRECDGLLFRSEPEILLYRALKAAGVSFAPLPVFVRGGTTYRRIEPDFVIVKDGLVMVVEVDGDTVHLETPVEAHNRTTMLAHEGVVIERVRAAECNTLPLAQACAERILGILAKIRGSRR